MEKQKCQHKSIRWEFSQFNPDCGVCYDCGKLVYAKNASSAIHDEDDPKYKEIILKTIRKSALRYEI